MEDYSLKKFLISPFPIKVLPYLLIAFALLGFFDATYLTIQHYQHTIPPCTVGGCETVLTSSFATVMGIPLALFGSAFYLVVMVLAGLYLSLRHSGDEQREDSRIDSGRVPHPKSTWFPEAALARMTTSLLFALCTFGLLVGLALIYIQAFVLHSWCYYCLFSELIDFLLFDASWWLYTNTRTS